MLLKNRVKHGLSQKNSLTLHINSRVKAPSGGHRTHTSFPAEGEDLAAVVTLLGRGRQTPAPGEAKFC